MSSTCFISYSRRNSCFAERLNSDLKRAGIDGWLDKGGIQPDAAWEPVIHEEIARRESFLLLASPEAEKSNRVAEELETAKQCGKCIAFLRVAGDDLPTAWQGHQMTDFRRGYWSPLATIVRFLKGKPVESLAQMVSRGNETVATAAKLLGGAESFHVDGREYRKLPIEPSGYTMSWLVAPADADLILPDELGVYLKFSGKAVRAHTLEEAMAFLSARGMKNIWMLAVFGHRNGAGDWDLPLDSPHVWQDAVEASLRALQQPFMSTRRLHIFLESPAVLAYELASHLRGMQTRYLYQMKYNPKCAEDRYAPVLWTK